MLFSLGKTHAPPGESESHLSVSLRGASQDSSGSCFSYPFANAKGQRKRADDTAARQGERKKHTAAGAASALKNSPSKFFVAASTRPSRCVSPAHHVPRDPARSGRHPAPMLPALLAGRPYDALLQPLHSWPRAVAAETHAPSSSRHDCVHARRQRTGRDVAAGRRPRA